MTEDEAKTKWCPMVNILIAPQNETWQGRLITSRGVIPADPRDTLCIASECMMWNPDVGTPETMITRLGISPEGDGWSHRGSPGDWGGGHLSQAWERTIELNTGGHCGLAK